MNSALVADANVDSQIDVDVVWEIRLRTWARKHYVSSTYRNRDWHPIILDEMERIDQGQ